MGRPVRRRLAASRATTTAGRWGKTERRLWATDSAPHLGQGRPVEVDRRRRVAVAMTALAVVLRSSEERVGFGRGVCGGVESGAGLYL
jgi:hypothetical protein